jgi:carbamoyl-phosphate synthase large subunit
LLEGRSVTTDGSLNVLLIGGWVDQAFTFVRSFARQQQINLFIADCWPNSPCGFSKVCRKFYRIPLYQDPQYLPAILDVCRQEQIDIVLPVHHEDVVEVAKGKELFQKANVRLPIPAYPLIEVAVDKYRMAQIARESGVAVPNTHLLGEIRTEDLGQSIDFPVLVKLRNSTGQRGQKKVWNIGQFEAHTRDLLETHTADQVIVQEYVAGHDHETMYTVGLLYNHNHQLRACIPLKKVRARPYTGGTAICTRAENRTELREMAVKLMSGLGPWKSIADIRCKSPRWATVFIELNPRPEGRCMVPTRPGWICHAVGQVALHEDVPFIEEFQEDPCQLLES